jgi:hypothetical protein
MKKIKVKVFSCFFEYIQEAVSCDPDNCSESQLLYVHWRKSNKSRETKMKSTYDSWAEILMWLSEQNLE